MAAGKIHMHTRLEPGVALPACPAVRARAGFLLPAAGLLLCLAGCGARYQRLDVQDVGGTPYLLLESVTGLPNGELSESYFSLFRPAAADLSAWEPFLLDLTGPVFGTFAWRADGADYLGVIHHGRVTLYRTGEKAGAPEGKVLPFGWIAETGAQAGNVLYLFGAGRVRQEGDLFVAPVAVASFEGGEFQELKVPNPPRVKSRQGSLDYGQCSFWIKALVHEGKVHLFWREAEGLGLGILDMEPPLTLTGPLVELVFDGRGFGPPREIRGLPGGYTAVWSTGAGLRAAVQPQLNDFGVTPPPRVFALPPTGDAVEDARPAPEPEVKLRFKHFLLERIPAEGREVLLRSNAQTFELWRGDDAGWAVAERPRGLPPLPMEALLFGLVGGCVASVATGVGLAWRRKRALRRIKRLLQPSDLVAPVGLRIAAYLMDLGLLVLAAEALTRLFGLPALRWSNIFYDVKIVPEFAVLYVGYLALAEGATGTTLGKRAMALAVVSDKGERLTFWAAFSRNLIGHFERHPMLAPFLSLLTILLTPRRQRLGDLLARSVVIQSTALEIYRRQRAVADGETARARAAAPTAESAAPGAGQAGKQEGK